MKKIFKYIALLILTTLITFINVNADTSYMIESYDVNIVVNENNKLEIEEKINTYFEEPKHGIKRTIPLKNNIYRADGTDQVTRARIKVNYVNDKYIIQRVNGDYSIRIGDENETITGKKDYVIDYDYFVRKDNVDTYDELYFNIIGTEWDTLIGYTTFKITMPKDFDSSKIGFSVGGKGASGYHEEFLTYDVDGKTITGAYKGILGSGNGLTIRIELPEGYFVYDNTSTKEATIIISATIVLLLLATFIWKRYCKEDQVIETVEFYPPEGLNPLDIANIYNGIVTNNDVISLLIVLANKGYIKISDYKEPGIIKKDGFLIKKLKEYDGDNEYEKLFMKDLFDCKKNKSGLIDQVTNKDLENEFYKTINKIENKILNSKDRKKYFERCKKCAWLLIIMLIIILISIIYPTYIYSPDLIALSLAFSFTGYILLYITCAFKSAKRFIIPAFLGLSLFTIAPTFAALNQSIQENKLFLVSSIIGTLAILLIAYYRYTSKKRTKKGLELYGKILGFKNFLKTAEKDKLEALVAETPEYFYNILPYTYVLGVSNKWIKKFETIGIQKPDWYDSPDAFDYYTFNTFMNRTMSTARSSMTSMPASSSGDSGSGFSGGGFSGGGSGGGGGSSW